VKNISKCLSALGLLFVLFMGLSQLTTSALPTPCPATLCDNNYLIDPWPIGSCWLGSEQQYIYQVYFSTVKTCYSPEDYSH